MQRHALLTTSTLLALACQAGAPPAGTAQANAPPPTPSPDTTPIDAGPPAAPVKATAPSPSAPATDTPAAVYGPTKATIPKRLTSAKLKECARSSNTVLRLTLAWDGSVLSIADCTGFNGIAPPGNETANSAVGEFSGSWAEIHDARGNVLFAWNVYSGLKCPHRESFSATGQPSSHSLPAGSKQAPSTALFTVPNFKDAATLVWFDHASCPPNGASKPLGAFDLR